MPRQSPLDPTVDHTMISHITHELSSYPAWMSEAHCAQATIDMFDNPQLFADTYCAQCPVVAHCASYARRFAISQGVFGHDIYST